MYFTHLHVHSHYSLLDGMSKIDELVDLAQQMNLDALALTDHGVLHGAIEFYKKARKKGIKPIIGCEVYLAPRSLYDKRPKIDTKLSHLVLLAKDFTGYQNLLKLVTIGELEGFYYKPRIDKKVLREHSEGLIGLSACLKGEIPQAILAKKYSKAKELIKEYQDIFGPDDFYLELQDHLEIPEQREVNKKLLQLSEEMKVKAVVTCDSHYPRKEDKRVHDVFLAIQTGTGIDDEERLRMTQTDLHLKTPQEIEEHFSRYPFLFDNIKEIVEKCNLTLNLGKLVFPKFATPNQEPAWEYLRKLALKRFLSFYPRHSTEAKQRLEHELEVIRETDFADYFLVIQDIINFAKEKGIMTNTRGSAAGSLVAYVLGITNIDPLKYHLYFERFLNPERIAPPDIDLDVADNRRQEIINYISQKYGSDKVAQVITFGIMKSRLAVRDVTRALGLPYSLGDQIAKLIPSNLSLTEALQNIPELRNLYETNPDAKEVIDIAHRLEGVARHASTHAAGVVIAPTPLVNYVPLQHSSRNEKEVVTQYDMYALQDVGLVKIDILGLANLTIIKNSLRIIKKVWGKEIDLDSLGFEDKKVYKLLSKGETVGVFQLESEGMRRYLQQLQPHNFEDIMAMLALYRPGPMELIPQFIRRKQGKEKIEYLHPKLKPILSSTYGICVFQEQLMRIAHDLAGFSMAEADILRKAVGKKIKSLLNAQKEKLIQGMVKNKVRREIAEKIWKWVEPFARYGFNKGHTASYARITYQTAWLKAHYPNAFMAALLTSDYGNLDRVAIEIQECERIGIKVLPPSVNKSFVEFGIDKKTGNIYFSLAAIKNVGVGLATVIQEERSKNGPFKNLSDFLERLPRQSLNRKSLESLAKAGALDCFGSRELIVEHLDRILKWAYQRANQKNQWQMGLWKEDDTDILEKIAKEKGIPDVDRSKRIEWEREFLGIYLTTHPLEGYKKVLAKISLLPSKIDWPYIGRRIRVGGFISQIHKIRTKKGEPMAFLQISDKHKNIEAIIFPSVLNNYLTVLAENKVVVVEGRVEKRNGTLQLIGEKIEEVKPLEV